VTAVSTPARGIESGAAGEVREQVRAALEKGKRLRILGAGTWLDAGRPVRANARLGLQTHAGIVEYVPGDLTITALAGTPLAELERATSAERQWLPLDPFGVEGGTLGATIATASSGPLAHGFGGVRDNVLGIEVVTGRGEIVRAGGRVVKNVAGFDLTRLMIGAWGTLGAITEVTVRLRARPEVDRTIIAPLPRDPHALEQLLAAIRRLPLTALALQLVNDELARRLDVGDAPCLLARIGGNEDSVRAQMAMIGQAVGARGTVSGGTGTGGGASGDAASSRTASGGALTEVSREVWQTLRECEHAESIVLRLAAATAMLPWLWTGATGAAAAVTGTYVHAWCGSGTVRMIVPADSEAMEDPAIAALVRALPEARRLGERLPPALWTRLVPSAVTDPVSRRVREAFDPRLLLNPGILGEVMA